MNRKIGVFLSSHAAVADCYHIAAKRLGEWIGKNGDTLVYGGARKGLMEVLAQSTKQSGGRVYGVVPQILVERNLVSDTIDVNFHCCDLNDRKAILIRESDILIAFPGGVGTLDELFTILAANAIGLEHKPVVLFNVDGCWDSLLALLKDLAERGFVSAEKTESLHVVTDESELEEILQP